MFVCVYGCVFVWGNTLFVCPLPQLIPLHHDRTLMLRAHNYASALFMLLSPNSPRSLFLFLSSLLLLFLCSLNIFLDLHVLLIPKTVCMHTYILLCIFWKKKGSSLLLFLIKYSLLKPDVLLSDRWQSCVYVLTDAHVAEQIKYKILSRGTL